MKKFVENIEFIRQNDRSIHSVFEVLFLPGVHAILLHRIAHLFYKLRLYTLGRIINSVSKCLTGVDIHPGAKIGSPIFLDHATGVVIGEQSTIGNNCVIYHGVTLGAKTQLGNSRRHPEIGDNVLIGCNATLLGHVIIKDKTIIKANELIIE